MAIAADAEPGSRALLVVCDGVSSSLDSDVASLAAARAARDVLDGRERSGHRHRVLPERCDRGAAQRSRRCRERRSTGEHHRRTARTRRPARSWPTVLEDDLLVAGVVGDSRAYWFPDDAEAVALTVDDSWAAELIATGVPRQEAESGPQAHAITRWLGKDAPDHTPRTTSLQVTGPGWLLVCSDGLWNYCSEAAPLADLTRQTAAAHGGDPLATASALVDWANAQGGQDNITVALARDLRSSTERTPEMAEFTATVYQNEFLPDGGTDVHAIVTVTCSGRRRGRPVRQRRRGRDHHRRHLRLDGRRRRPGRRVRRADRARPDPRRGLVRGHLRQRPGAAGLPAVTPSR